MPPAPGRANALSDAAGFRAALLAWFDRAKRVLPWRRDTDPYRVWLSEIMLQQTRVDTVVPYYERFLARFPDVRALAAAPLADVLKCWEGLGYYARARNLHRAARLLIDQHAGRLPENSDQWRALPGIGEYTAAAIASISAGEPAAALDGNSKRVLARVTAETAPIDQPATLRLLAETSRRLLDPQRPGDFNQALMELGETICTPAGPACSTCPVARWCLARATGQAAHLPRKSARRPAARVRAVAAGTWHRGRLLLIRREERGLLGGLWQLPSAPQTSGRRADSILLDLLAEVCPADFEIEGRCARVEHQFTHRHLTLDVYRCRVAGGRTALRDSRRARWLRPIDLDEVPLARLDQKAVGALLQSFGLDSVFDSGRLRSASRAR